MLDFSNFFKNHFASDRISDDTLNKFTLELIPRLSGYARFGAMVSATLNAYTGYFGAVSDEASKAAIQAALTRAVGRAMDGFKGLVSRHEGFFRSKFGADSPEYVRFYPQGISEYGEANLANIGEKMRRYEVALVDPAFGATISEDVKADFINDGQNGNPVGVILRFRAARQAQLDAKGATTTSKSFAHSSRTSLEVQLMRDLLGVAQDAQGRPDAEQAELLKIFPQYILEGRAPRPEEGAPAPAPVTPA